MVQITYQPQLAGERPISEPSINSGAEHEIILKPAPNCCWSNSENQLNIIPLIIPFSRWKLDVLEHFFPSLFQSGIQFLEGDLKFGEKQHSPKFLHQKYIEGLWSGDISHRILP